MESACPSDAEIDEDFQFLVDTTSFELPKVRLFWNSGVSPPPPPPAILATYDALVSLDPHGFQLVRQKMEHMFPRLSDVATSSIGASVGDYIADFTVTPEQLTKAYLASHGMDKDGLGARVVESKFTGRWRPACMELHRMFDDPKLAFAGEASEAYLRGNPHYNDNSQSGQFDRNLLLYAMLEIKLSLDKASLADEVFSTLDLYDTICGGGVGGYRTPVRQSQWFTYDFQSGYEIDNFSPISMYGSLETVRSAYLAQNNPCARADFALEDVAHQVYCQGVGPQRQGQFSDLREEMRTRRRYAPFAMHRDRYCSAIWDISIEDALARPPQHDDSLFDAPLKNRASLTPPPDGTGYIVPSFFRGEENIVFRRYFLSLRSFVYITSSSDPSVRPGMHRLLDIPLFSSSTCRELPNVNCAPPGRIFRLNEGDAALQAHEASSVYRPGRHMVKSVRCSVLMQQVTGVSCISNPYAAAQDPSRSCYQGSLALTSRPVLYSSTTWLETLTAPPPQPPPYSPSPPPPCPLPPAPFSPPSPPFAESQFAVMRHVRTIQEEACTSVYYLTAATRCERLAVAITENVLYTRNSPPLRPPAPPVPTYNSPPSPRPPPSPNLPEGLSAAPVMAIRASTVRYPTIGTVTYQNRVLFRDGFYMEASFRVGVYAALWAVNTVQPNLMDCAPDGLSSTYPWGVVPCVTSVEESACIPQMRHCGDDAKNGQDPFVEFTLSGMPRSRQSRLWGVEITLPETEELASLFFSSADPSGGVGYEILVYDEHGAPLPCASQGDQNYAFELPTDHKVMHVCSISTTDAEVYSLQHAFRVRIHLFGAFRQVWFRDVTLYEMSIAASEIDPQPPEPPPLPMLPPVPPSPPSASCTFHTRLFYDDRTLLREEACGLTQDECCAVAHAVASFGFEVDNGGCCLLFDDPVGSLSLKATDFYRVSQLSGTGVVV